MRALSDVEALMIRRRILYSGRVQGVCFRQTATDLSSGFEVVGFVRNLADGRVELVVEGAAAELDRFQEAIKMEMRANIADQDVSETVATGEFSSFRIAF